MSESTPPIPEYEFPVVGTPASNPKKYLATNKECGQAHQQLLRNDLRSAIIASFGLAPTDSYVYHAIASVTLAQVQSTIKAGTQHNLCDWYLDEKDVPVGHPSSSDIQAYTDIFLPIVVSPAKLLKSYAANAKKGSIRADIGANLLSKRYVASTFPPIPKPSKAAMKNALANPYLDFWFWSCQALHWAGPGTNTSNIKTSHAVLPIFMHHFGCVVPSRESLEAIKIVALNGAKEPSTIIDLGSGNGYWTYMLRAMKLPVIAVDNHQSVFRCNWIGDTIIKDGVHFLKNRKGGIDDVLLLVYPVVGADFFSAMLDAYKGDRILVAGTQCRNGYTAFKDQLVDEWMAREKPNWTFELRIPLPSFPGKDEALYFFRKSMPAT